MLGHPWYLVVLLAAPSLVRGQVSDDDLCRREALVRSCVDSNDPEGAIAGSEKLAALARSMQAARPMRAFEAFVTAGRGYRFGNRYRDAAVLFETAADGRLRLREAGPGSADEVARAYHQSGVAWELLGDYPRALAAYRHGLSASERFGGVDARLRWELLWSMGRLQCGAGDGTEGRARLLDALKAAQGLTPADPRAVARANASLGFAWLVADPAAERVEPRAEARARFVEAGKYYQGRAAREAEAMAMDEGTEYLLIQVGMCVALREGGNAESAERFLTRSLEFLKAGGPAALDPTGELERIVRVELALAKLARGNVADADRELSAAIGRATAGDRSPHKTSALWQQAVVRGVGLGRAKDVVARAGELLESDFRALTVGFDHQGDRERMVAFRNSRPHLDIYLTLAVDAAEPDETVYRRVLAWKGAASSRSMVDAALASGTEDQRRAVLSLRGRWADATAGLRDPAFAGGTKDGLARLRYERERVEGDLYRIAREVAATSPAIAHAPADVAAALPPSVAFVDFLTYTHYRPLPERPGGPTPLSFPAEERVLAFVTRPGRPTKCVRLPATLKAIEERIDEWHAAAIRRDSTASRIAADLGKAVWDPLASHLDGVSGVVISPDRGLWRLPFAALPGRRAGGYLIEDRALAYALSGRHAAAMFPAGRAPPDGDGKVLVVGDIEYGPRNDPRSGLDPVEGAARWVDWAGGHISKSPRTVLRTGNASGANTLKEFAGGYREIAIFGHGPAADRREGFPMPAGSPFGLWVPNGPSTPWRLSLPLAGANAEPPGGPDRPSPEDFQLLDMGGVWVLWWWGCDTSAGPLVAAEAALGFPRAFLLAGCRAVLTSFVEVETGPTAAFSRMVHRGVRDRGMSPGQALRNAQLCWIRHGVDQSHPGSWAHWVLIGDPGDMADRAVEPSVLAEEADPRGWPVAEPPPEPETSRPIVWLAGIAVGVQGVLAVRLAGKRGPKPD